MNGRRSRRARPRESAPAHRRHRLPRLDSPDSSTATSSTATSSTAAPPSLAPVAWLLCRPSSAKRAAVAMLTPDAARVRSVLSRVRERGWRGPLLGFARLAPGYCARLLPRGLPGGGLPFRHSSAARARPGLPRGPHQGYRAATGVGRRPGVLARPRRRARRRARRAAPPGRTTTSLPGAWATVSRSARATCAR